MKRVNGGGCIKGFPREVTSVGRSFYQQSMQARPSIRSMILLIHRPCMAGCICMQGRADDVPTSLDSWLPGSSSPLPSSYVR